MGLNGLNDSEETALSHLLDDFNRGDPNSGQKFAQGTEGALQMEGSRVSPQQGFVDPGPAKED